VVEKRWSRLPNPDKRNITAGDAENGLTTPEPFDYTKWQENLFEDMTIEELAKKADEYVKNNNV
jgi:hypothetical protein